MDKVIEDGKVAVLYSPGFGAGWYSWNTSTPECLFDPEIVQMVREVTNPKFIVELANKKWNRGDDYFYPGGADQLLIDWVPEGTRFFIEEYDGSECVMTEPDVDWLTA